MKRMIKFCMMAFITIAAISCKSDFEKEPLNLITEDYIWDEQDATGTYASQWVSWVYTRIPSYFNRVNGLPLDCASDDAVPSNVGNATWNVIRSGYSAAATWDDFMSRDYSGIRAANIFLANYKRVPWGSPEVPRQFAAEVRGLRAYFYYDMLKRYGGVPIIGDKVFDPTSSDVFQLKRNSVDSCVNYIVSELNAIQDSLPPDPTFAQKSSGNGTKDGSDPNAGRLRKSTVLAIKAKVLLLAASPLFNATAYPEKDYTGYPAYSADRWKAAADAAKAVMDMKDAAGVPLFALENDRYVLWKTYINKEHIFVRNGGEVKPTWSQWMSPVGYVVGGTASQGLISPTQELIDAFPMKNGKSITDPTSGYDASKPYLNRDPRLDQTVFYNGATWLKRAVETFEGGKDKPNSATVPVQTQTGYYCKKFCANDGNSSAFTSTCFTTTKGDWGYLIRYADILLMYAEAQNEFSGPDASVYNAVEAVRKRAGLSPYTLPVGLNQSQMRDVIRNERRVELAFEEERFWDIRRWKLAESVYGNTLHGVTITKNQDGTFTYSRKDVVTPYFNNNMYLYPIALKETQVNPGLLQNPGY